ncbi:MAG: ABC transporter permease [Candidatus Hydrogenedentes bacterium]|nr:ABC transporter permease [Candidatus Hydrogenedentota bacterium]
MITSRAKSIYLDLKTSFLHALTITLRRDRFILMSIISVLPVMIPIFVALFSKTLFRENGLEIFVKLCEQVYIHTIAPLLALFLGLIGIREEVDSLTIIYLLTRPVSKFAWVLGRFIAYFLVSAFLMVMGIFFTFTSCVILGSIHFDTTGVSLMLQYMGVGLAGLIAYGAISFSLGTAINHPIIAGVILFFGWEKLANYIPGIADFWTVQKYLDSMFPALATQRYNRAVVSVLGSFQKELYFVSINRALVTIFISTVIFLALSVFSMRYREFTKDRVVGSK